MGKLKEIDSNEELRNPYDGLDVGAVVLAARAFHSTPLQVSQCKEVLCQLIVLAQHGATFKQKDSEAIFFGLTKLFQSQDTALRRLVYVASKVFLKANEAQSFVLVSSLLKDAGGTDPSLRACAVRLLASIVKSQPSLLAQTERFFKQALTCGDAHVASAALVAGLSLMQVPAHADTIKRGWRNEVASLITVEDPMTQFHALLLSFEIRQDDARAVVKLLQDLTRAPPKSTLARVAAVAKTCAALRSLLPRDPRGQSPLVAPLLLSLTQTLRARGVSVAFAAARQVLLSLAPQLSQLPALKPLLEGAIHVLQEMMASTQSAHRLAATRVLSQLSKVVEPRSQLFSILSTLLTSMEELASDSSPAVAVLAMTTLLALGDGSHIRALYKRLSGQGGQSKWLSTVPDDLKEKLVLAIQARALQRGNTEDAEFFGTVTFLSHLLREEGGSEYKSRIVDTICGVVDGGGGGSEQTAAALACALDALADFVEDCEYPFLSVKVLGWMGTRAGHSPDASRYVRVLFNRVILEVPAVRAAAVGALANIARDCESLRSDIRVLLQRAQSDSDDEVRDRACTELASLDQPEDSDELPDLADLEYSLQQFLAGDMINAFVTDMVTTVPPEAQPQKTETEATTSTAAPLESSPASPRQQGADLVAAAKKMPSMKRFGEILQSSDLITLADADGEFRVQAMTHCYDKRVLLVQFLVHNSLSETVDKVKVSLDSESFVKRHAKLLGVVPVAGTLTPGASGVCCAVFGVHPRLNPPQVRLSCTLRFEVENAGYEDEYPLNTLSVTPDHFAA